YDLHRPRRHDIHGFPEPRAGGSRTRSRASRQPPRTGHRKNGIIHGYRPSGCPNAFRAERLMRNMSRIRNTLRFQSPEERVLNRLLALVLVVLISVGIAKVRDDRVEAASEVKGITVTRQQPVRAVSHRPATT